MMAEDHMDRNPNEDEQDRKTPAENKSVLNRSTQELEQALKEANSFQSFSSEMNEEFLSVDVGKDLAALIKAHKVKKADLFLNANIHENYGYQILSGKRYPSREVLLSIFLSLHLSVDEANLFLKTHGFSPLYVRRKFDAAVAYSLMHGWSVMKCNELLHDNGLPLLKKETM